MNAPKTDMAECGSQVAGPPSMDVWCGAQSERYHGTSCCVGGNAGLGSALRDIETASTKKWLAHWLWLPDADGVSLSSESGSLLLRMQTSSSFLVATVGGGQRSSH